MGRGIELFLPSVGLSGQAARALCRPARVHRSGQIPQRDRQLRPARVERPLDQPHHLHLGRAGSGRSQARHVRVGRRPHQLPHRHRLSGPRCGARPLLAGRCPCDRQGHHPVPRHLLARLSDVGGPAAAEADRGARVSVQPRREDVEVGRQRDQPDDAGRTLRRRSPALLLPARGAVRPGRQLFARSDRGADQRRSRRTISAIWRNARSP